MPDTHTFSNIGRNEFTTFDGRFRPSKLTSKYEILTLSLVTLLGCFRKAKDVNTIADTMLTLGSGISYYGILRLNLLYGGPVPC